MADGFGDMKLREERNVYGTLTPDPDGDPNTLTIVSATVTLKDEDDNVVGTPPVSNVPATSFTDGESTAPEAWYLLKPTALALSPGSYVAEFLIVCDNGCKYEPVVSVIVCDD